MQKFTFSFVFYFCVFVSESQGTARPSVPFANSVTHSFRISSPLHTSFSLSLPSSFKTLLEILTINHFFLSIGCHICFQNVQYSSIWSFFFFACCVFKRFTDVYNYGKHRSTSRTLKEAAIPDSRAQILKKILQPEYKVFTNDQKFLITIYQSHHF